MRASLAQRSAYLARLIAWSRARAVARALVPRRGRDALRRAKARLLMLAYRGDRVECPCCGGRWREFLPAWNRPNAICPRCRSHERHRALWLYLGARHRELFTEPMSLLHLAPEESIEPLLRALPELAYTTADIASPLADERFDITAIPHADASFDSIICSHVLEHVDDDRAAMRELRRVLRPGGWAIVMVPVDDTRAETYEDPTITDPAERRRAFHQEDHVRVYGRDFPERLRAAGFDVTLDDFPARLDPRLRERYGASPAPIPVCRRPA